MNHQTNKNNSKTQQQHHHQQQQQLQQQPNIIIIKHHIPMIKETAPILLSNRNQNQQQRISAIKKCDSASSPQTTSTMILKTVQKQPASTDTATATATATNAVFAATTLPGPITIVTTKATTNCGNAAIGNSRLVNRIPGLNVQFHSGLIINATTQTMEPDIVVDHTSATLSPTLSSTHSSSLSSLLSPTMQASSMGGTSLLSEADAAADAALEANSNASDHSDSPNGREARNRAEKNRRDKLNSSIQELSTMVPHVAESSRRVDKTAVLRFAAHGMRLKYVFDNSLNKKKPQITDSMMKLLDSFLIVITCHGQIVLVSSSVEEHLGHCQADLYGQDIMNITHPDDKVMFRRQLIPTDLESLFDSQPEDQSDEPIPRTREEEEYIERKLREDTRNFTVRLSRAGPRSEPTSYEVVKIDGCFRRSDMSPRGVKTTSNPSGLQRVCRSRGRDDPIALQNISGNDIVLVALARLIRPPKMINRLLEANFFEYKTRHLIDGRIIDCDQRIGLVAGYMTEEVKNLSPFTFMHQDDVRWVIVALRQMYDCNSDYGESCYRLLSRNGHFIYLQTKGYLEIDKETNKVHSFVCVNTLLDEAEGRRRVNEMKNKFSVIINTKIPSSSAIDVPASENPQQLEKAVMYLIQNLQKSPDDDDNNDGSSSGALSAPMGAASSSPRSIYNAMSPAGRAASACSMRSTKTPPLALVPPDASTVKTSISKSVTAVNITAAKNLRGLQAQSPLMKTPSPEPQAADIKTTVQQQQQQRPSVLQRSGSCSGNGIISLSTSSSSNQPAQFKREEDFLSSNVDGGVARSKTSPTRRVPPLVTNCSNCQEYNAGEGVLNNNNNNSNHHRLLHHHPSQSQQISVLKRTHIKMEKDEYDGHCDDYEDAAAAGSARVKRRFTTNEIQEAFSTSFQQIDNSLNRIEHVATDLLEKQTRFEVLPDSHQQLGEILEESENQKKILLNIKSEYSDIIRSGQVTAATTNQQLLLEDNISQKNDLKPR